MGNVLLDDYKKDDPMENFDKWLEENPELTGKQILADNKLFLTTCFKYRLNRVVIKTYFKRDNTSVIDYLKSFDIISNLTLKHKCANILPLSIIHSKQMLLNQRQNPNIIMATRQYLPYTLQEKLQSRPYMSLNEKRWYIFQMIVAVDLVHTHLDLYHGNIRTSNFLVSNFEYLYLTDFANYKPTYILDDTEQGLAQFRLFYASSQAKCFIAPEKLQGRSQSANKTKKPEYLFNLYRQSQPDLKLSGTAKDDRSKRQLDAKSIAYFSHMNNLKQMDLFSLGLSILQVLNDGKTTFTYENLLNLKKNKFNLQELMQNIINSQSSHSQSELKQIRLIVNQLLLKKRENICPLIERFPNFIKDDVFVLFWHVLSVFTKVSFQLSDHRIYLLQAIIDYIEKQIKRSGYQFRMSRAKSLQNFSALKIFTQLIKKKLIYTLQIAPTSLLGQILTAVQKKDREHFLIQSDQEPDKSPQNNPRQSFFINQSKKKRISKRASFLGHPDTRIKDKLLCPPLADEHLESLITDIPQSRGARLTADERRSLRMQCLLRQFRADQSIRFESQSQRSLFYANYELVIKVVFACVRTCKYIASKLIGVQLINVISKESADSTILRISIPLLIHLAQDSDVNVAKYAFNSMIDMFYNFIDPFQLEEDLGYYHIFLEFFLNVIKGGNATANIREFMFSRFKEVYNIISWLEICYLKVHRKYIHINNMMRSSIQISDFNSQLNFPKYSQSQQSPFSTFNYEETAYTSVSSFSSAPSNKHHINFYKIVDHLKIYYGSFSSKQIQILMENVPIEILPEMFEFYISFLNTQRIMGLKCSLFIAKNYSKQFELQKNMLQVFDNCIQTGLTDVGVALYYSIKYFRLRKNTSLDIVHKIAPHIINPHRWVRDEALNFIKMCLEQYPPTKIFFLFRDTFDAPFPLSVENLNQQILLPEALKDVDVNYKQKKFTNRINRKIGLTEKKFIEYLSAVKPLKDNFKNRTECKEKWQNQTKKFRYLEVNSQVNNFNRSLRRTIEQLYEYNFFHYGFSLNMKFNPLEKQVGLQKMFDSLKKFSKFSIDGKQITQQHKQFFESLFATINNNFEKFVLKHIEEITPQKLKLACCINIIAEQLYRFYQVKVKPSINFGSSSVNTNQSRSNIERNFKPKGIQVTQIYQNKDTISGLVSVGDIFFLSSCYDGILRIYNTKSIEMNIVTQSQAAIEIRSENNEQKVKINTLACLQSTYTAIIGTNKGQIKGYQIQRMPGKLDNSRLKASENQTQLFKYNVTGDIQKLIAPKNTYLNQCISYITSDLILGIQDIRCKEISLKCNLGKQRGYCLTLSSNEKTSLLVGTVDGYLLNYDIRFNLISSILQLHKDDQAIPITNIIKLKNQQKFCVTYPSNNFQFAQFNLESPQIRIQPLRLFSGTSFANKQQQSIPSVPYFENKTNDEVFKLCNNSIHKHIYYSKLSNFDQNYKILDYVSEPLTLKQSKIRQFWANGCRHRYTQILSIYNKKSLPFVEYLPNGILTNLNPNPQTFRSKNDSSQTFYSNRKQLTFLVQKRTYSNQNIRKTSTDVYSSSSGQHQSSSMFTSDIDRQLVTKINKIKISSFDQEENKQFYTSCAIVNGFVVVGGKNSRIKLFK